MDELHKLLKIVFASEFAFYMQAHRFHWNVEGSNFVQLHKLFGDIYEEVHASIDVFAEQIRAINTYVPGTLDSLSMLSVVGESETEFKDGDMVSKLLVDSEKMSKMFGVLVQMAENEKLYGLVEFLSGRQDAHNKHSWMLRSLLK